MDVLKRCLRCGLTPRRIASEDQLIYLSSRKICQVTLGALWQTRNGRVMLVVVVSFSNVLRRVGGGGHGLVPLPFVIDTAANHLVDSRRHHASQNPNHCYMAPWRWFLAPFDSSLHDLQRWLVGDAPAS